ncbi:MAG: FAD-dependent oxidoreductase [Verrucomicrobiota bacterium]|nr:FAD-dependent oxidoreductase [Verrucomicrobiota bacterium]
MKVVIIGGVAAGPKVASKIRRLDANAEITVIEKGVFLSYAGCGLPYYISGVVDSQEELMETPVGTVRDTAFFKNVKNVNVLNKTEATAIDREAKTVDVVDSKGKKETLQYDKLVFATGAAPVKPPFPGINLNHIYTLHGVEDAEGIKTSVKDRKAKDTVIVGGGLIGVEMAEALSEMGCRVTIVELLPQILSMMDADMIVHVEKYLESKGIRILTKTKVLGFEGKDQVEQVNTDKQSIPADLVILGIGVKPNSQLAESAKLEIGESSGIKVNKYMQTSDPDIYALGDAVESIHQVSAKPCYVPLGSIANKHGRVAANHICGINDEFPPILGSFICKIFDYSVAATGLSEKSALENGFDIVTCHAPAPDKPHFMPTMKPILIKLIVDRKTRKIIGAQGFGLGDVDKRINTAAMAITAEMTVDKLANADLLYAPPFSPAMDNIITACNIVRNKLDGLVEGISVEETKKKMDANEDIIILDVRSPKELETMKIKGSINIPLGKLRNSLDKLDKNKEIITFCKISLRGYEAYRILKANGFKKIRVMDGGLLMWPYEK